MVALLILWGSYLEMEQEKVKMSPSNMSVGLTVNVGFENSSVSGTEKAHWRFLVRTGRRNRGSNDFREKKLKQQRSYR